MRYFLFFICLLLPFHSNAQSFIDFEHKDDVTTCRCNDIPAQTILDTLDTIKDDRFLACCYHCIGAEYFYNEEDWSATQYYKKSIKIREQYQDDLLWKSYRNIAYAYKESFHYEKAIRAILRGFELSDKLKETRTYIYLGESYTELGEFENAIEALENAERLAENNYQLAEANNALCITLTKTQNTSNLLKALKHAKKAIELFKRENDILGVAIAYLNKGNAHEELKQHEEAIQAYNQAKEIFSQENLPLYLAKTINNIATTRYAQGQYNEAIEQLKESLKIKKEYYENDAYQYDYAANYENLADNYEALGNFDEALLHYQLALQNLTDNFRDKDIHQNPMPSDNSLYVYNKIILIFVLHRKAAVAFKKYQEEGDMTYLNLAEKTYNTAFDFHNQLLQQITTQESRLFQAEVIVPFIENALAVAHKLQETQEQTPETAYRFMEKNKATVLMQAINENRALQYAGLPDSLLQQERELRENITAYEKQLNDARQYEEKEAIKQYETLLFEQKNTYNQLVRNLENNHPEYYNLKYKQNTTTLKDAQNYLDNGTALLEYFVGDSSVYVLVIEKNTADLHRLDKPENWDKTLNDFRKSISNVKTGVSFAPNAHQLYKWLLSKPLEGLNTSIQRLQIIPDAQLNYLPFGLLLTEVPPKEPTYKLPYLLKDKSISYAYSTTLLLENQQQNRSRAALVYGGFAPQYNNIAHQDLPEGRKNVEAQATKFKGKSFLADQATKEQFRDSANQFRILQLSMHGILNDEKPLYSKLIFSNDEPLYAADIYNTRLNADLAILSACNTGTGNIKKGEGVMSLSRVFTYAGCPSLLMSLWSVPDGSTATLIDTFLEQLKQGKTKDKALQIAQVNYLNQASTTQHPAHWAGFVPSGDMQAMDFGRNWSWWWLAVLIFVVTTFIFFRKNRT